LGAHGGVPAQGERAASLGWLPDSNSYNSGRSFAPAFCQLRTYHWASGLSRGGERAGADATSGLGRAFFYAWTQAIFVTIDQFSRIGKGVGLGSIHLNPDQLGLFIEHYGLEHTPVALFISEANQIPMS